jgi:hypothetical protein
MNISFNNGNWNYSAILFKINIKIGNERHMQMYVSVYTYLQSTI